MFLQQQKELKFKYKHCHYSTYPDVGLYCSAFFMSVLFMEMLVPSLHDKTMSFFTSKHSKNHWVNTTKYTALQNVIKIV